MRFSGKVAIVAGAGGMGLNIASDLIGADRQGHAPGRALDGLEIALEGGPAIRPPSARSATAAPEPGPGGRSDPAGRAARARY